MDFLNYVLEFLLLVFLGGFLYVAKRDLNATAALRQSPAAQEIAELRETVEQLIGVLEERASAAEARLQLLIERADSLERTHSLEHADAPSSGEGDQDADIVSVNDPGVEDPKPATRRSQTRSQPTDRYAPVWLLMDSGVSDTAEIARQTGFGQAEVNLVISLRQR